MIHEQMTINLIPDEFNTIVELINFLILINVRKESFQNAELLREFKKDLIKKRDMSLLLNQFNYNLF